MSLRLILNVIASCVLACGNFHTVRAEPVAEPVFVSTGVVQDPQLTEISGLARSRVRAGLLWAINDSGHAASLHALNLQGQRLASVPVEGVNNFDWEDLQSLELHGRPYLLIADTGDNFAFRSELRLILVPEPALDALSVRPERVIRFSFEGGARDCEAVAVDAPRGRILLADKGRQPAGLFALDLDGPDQGRVARRIADLPDLIPEALRPGARGSLLRRATPTSMGLSDDGRRLVVLSYLSLSVFERGADPEWPQRLRHASPSQRLPSQPLFEALALNPDGRSGWVVTEGQRAPMYRWTEGLSSGDDPATGAGESVQQP